MLALTNRRGHLRLLKDVRIQKAILDDFDLTLGLGWVSLNVVRANDYVIRRRVLFAIGVLFTFFLLFVVDYLIYNVARPLLTHNESA